MTLRAFDAARQAETACLVLMTATESFVLEIVDLFVGQRRDDRGTRGHGMGGHARTHCGPAKPPRIPAFERGRGPPC